MQRSPSLRLPSLPSRQIRSRASVPFAVGHDADAIDLAVGLEQLTQFVFRRVEIQVSHKDVLQASASGVSYLSVGDFGREAGGT